MLKMGSNMSPKLERQCLEARQSRLMHGKSGHCSAHMPGSLGYDHLCTCNSVCVVSMRFLSLMAKSDIMAALFDSSTSQKQTWLSKTYVCRS